MRASIIIPLYNQAEYVAAAIYTALNQSHRPLEVIVVNDGSSDDSLAVAQRVLVDRFDLKRCVHLPTAAEISGVTLAGIEGDDFSVRLINQANKGLAGARTAGLLNSTGEAILPLDADDRIEPDYLARTMPILMENPQVGIVATDWRMFGLESRIVRIPSEITLEHEMQANDIPVCSLIRRAALLETGGWNPRLSVYEDWNMWIDILKRGWQVATLHEVLFWYRRRRGSMVEQTTGRHTEFTAQVRALHPELFGGRERERKPASEVLSL